jgi:hypothetical protein
VTRTVATVMIATIVVTSWVAAQGPIRVGVDLVHLGIVVTDRQGAPITRRLAAGRDQIEATRSQRRKDSHPAGLLCARLAAFPLMVTTSANLVAPRTGPLAQ